MGYSKYLLTMGICQHGSLTASPAFIISLTKAESFENKPAVLSPNAMTHAPVNVATSITYNGTTQIGFRH